MTIRSLFLGALMFTRVVWGYEIPDENEVVSRTCRLAVKVEVIRDSMLERPSGRALVTAHLFDGDGNPYRGERIELTATTGTFICRLPDDSSTADAELSKDCYSTGDDGKAKIYLVNIPFNQKVHIKANYDCDDRLITGTASLSVSRSVVRKKKPVRPKP
ncbi:MAG: hypothetical protein JW913_05110 [Chitinispirillaceae bacterium]|nr:hypothetical protein [Chitinispirillaceae bacterium]